MTEKINPGGHASKLFMLALLVVGVTFKKFGVLVR